VGNARNPRGTKQLDVVLGEFEQVHGFNSARCISKGYDGPFAFDHLEIVVEPAVCQGHLCVAKALTLFSLHRRISRSLLRHS
jgi:hypothetical protein